MNRDQQPPTPGFNRRLREADAEYARRRAVRETQEAEARLAAGWDPTVGARAATKSHKRRQAISRRHRLNRGNAHQD